MTTYDVLNRIANNAITVSILERTRAFRRRVFASSKEQITIDAMNSLEDRIQRSSYPIGRAINQKAIEGIQTKRVRTRKVRS